MFRSVLYICVLLRAVYCGPDLCENKAIVDSIVSVKNMWFFTSGGHYWWIKQKDFPPRSPGKPLPSGFKKGEAAFYWNSLDACASVQSSGPKLEGQDIFVTEMVSGQNKYLKFNTKTGEWHNDGKAVPYYEEKALKAVEVEWTKPIDSMFVYKMDKLVTFQENKSYSVIELKNLCLGPDRDAVVKNRHKIQDFDIINPPDAMTAVPRNH